MEIHVGALVRGRVRRYLQHVEGLAGKGEFVVFEDKALLDSTFYITCSDVIWAGIVRDLKKMGMEV